MKVFLLVSVGRSLGWCAYTAWMDRCDMASHVRNNLVQQHLGKGQNMKIMFLLIASLIHAGHDVAHS